MGLIKVEVVYAAFEKQALLKLMVERGSTIAKVIQQSGILQMFPEIDLQKQKVGIFSQKKALEEIVKAGDRIEIYRELIIDPKEARRARDKKTKRLR